MLMEKSTYEIMTPESVGLSASALVLGKHSGRHAFKKRLIELGHELDDEKLNRAFDRFKTLADLKKEVFDEDLEAIVADECPGGRNTNWATSPSPAVPLPWPPPPCRLEINGVTGTYRRTG